MAKKSDYIKELEKVRAAQNAIEKLYLGGKPDDEISSTDAANMKKTYWAVYGEEVAPEEVAPEGVAPEGVAAMKTKGINSWNC